MNDETKSWSSIAFLFSHWFHSTGSGNRQGPAKLVCSNFVCVKVISVFRLGRYFHASSSTTWLYFLSKYGHAPIAWHAHVSHSISIDHYTPVLHTITCWAHTTTPVDLLFSSQKRIYGKTGIASSTTKPEVHTEANLPGLGLRSETFKLLVTFSCACRSNQILRKLKKKCFCVVLSSCRQNA